MNARFLLLLALGAISSGCVTPPEQSQTAAAGAAPMPMRSRMALTGTRLPPLDDDDAGTGALGAITGDDWRGNEANRVKILCGENPAACSNNTGAKLH
jgi:hypothetical protein